MRLLFLSLCLAAGGVFAESEWQPLFDGKSLQGWRNYRSENVRKQCIVTGGELKLTGKGGGDLITERSFQNFELTVDWKVSEGGNSGIFFLADESADRIYFNAPEVQILDDARHADGKISSHRSGSLYDLVASPDASQKAAGEWNTTTIRIHKSQLTVHHNELLVTDIKIGSNTWDELVANSKFKNWPGFGKNSRGHIGLQDHGDQVSFRNIKIRELNND